MLDSATMQQANNNLSLDFVKRLIDRFEHEYAECLDQWHRLDLKAQGLTGIAGVLMTGVLAITKTSETTFTVVDKVGLTSALLCLSISLFSALAALRIRATNAGYPAAAQKKWLESFLSSGYNQDGEALSEFLLTTVAQEWSTKNAELKSLLNDKAAPLKTGYVTVTLGIVIVGLIVLMQIWLRS